MNLTRKFPKPYLTNATCQIRSLFRVVVLIRIKGLSCCCGDQNQTIMLSIKRPLVVLSLLALTTCEAFVPTTKSQMASGNVMATTRGAKSAFVPLFQGGGSHIPMGIHTTTTTALSMIGNGNLIDRFTRVVKSNINKFVSSIENPEKIIVQAVDDMQVSRISCDARV
jgi:hypothetical protein